MVDNRKESLWIRCPICKGKTRTKVYEDTVLVISRYTVRGVNKKFG